MPPESCQCLRTERLYRRSTGAEQERDALSLRNGEKVIIATMGIIISPGWAGPTSPRNKSLRIKVERKTRRIGAH